MSLSILVHNMNIKAEEGYLCTYQEILWLHIAVKNAGIALMQPILIKTVLVSEQPHRATEMRFTMPSAASLAMRMRRESGSSTLRL